MKRVLKWLFAAIAVVALTPLAVLNGWLVGTWLFAKPACVTMARHDPYACNRYSSDLFAQNTLRGWLYARGWKTYELPGDKDPPQAKERVNGGRS